MTVESPPTLIAPDRPKPVRTPTTLQMEAVECGAACLSMILAHHGRICTLPELRRECGVSRDGSKASNILKAARRYGLKARGFKKEIDGVQAVVPPFIVFWNFNHFVVVDGFKGEHVLLNDPGAGHRKVELAEFDECFTGVVLTFEKTDEFVPGGKKPSLLQAILHRLRGAWPALLYCFFAGFLLAIPGLVLPALTQVYLDSVLGEQRLDWLRPLTLVMGCAVLLVTCLTFLQRKYLRRLKVALSVKLGSQFFWHLLRLPANFYSQRYAGEVAMRTQLNDKLADVLSGRLVSTIIDIVMMGFYALMMACYDVTLALIGVFFAGLNFLGLHLLGKRRVEANMRLQRDYGRVGGESIAALQSMETLKAAGQESAFFARWAGFYAKASNSRQDLLLPSQGLTVIPELLSNLTVLALFVVGGMKVIAGTMTIGMLVALQALLISFLRPINDLVNLGATIQELEGDLGRVDDVLAHETEAIAESSDGAALEGRLKLEGYLEMVDLSFGYSPLDPPLIEGFNLSIQPGERIALIGGSGSGKSTLANLICGLYQPWSGEVLMDGAPRREVPLDLLANSFAVVSQEIFLFHGTVRDNLTLWDDTVSEANIRRACEDAAILDTVMALPGGLDATLLEGGANLSGGQRQRLEIARALVNDPSILVLDEATSALDAETEGIIDERLRLRGCTCVIIAHRLSTIRDCDEIILLEKGRVIERGTHEELWAKGGAYAEFLRTTTVPEEV